MPQDITRVVIAGIDNEIENFSYTMQELKALAQANYMKVVMEISQKLPKPVSGTYFGTGKAEEIKNAALASEAETVIVNDELTPTQIRNLEKLTDLTVIDRTALILQIFASRARTKEAKLQVQIAQLQYQLPRLHTSSATKLDQQSAGGGYSNRGAGETKLELNRRVIEKRISHLKAQLKDIDKDHQIQRKQRDSSGIKTVALVGYTNAGKSTTMNGLLRLTGQEDDKQVFEKDMLFATLDTSVRKIHFKDNKEILLSDTVGFVSKLPHQLVKSFRSTLAEAAQADLLIQVIDGSDENARDMIATTEETLKEIGVTEIPMIYAYNKADLAGQSYPLLAGDSFTYSARDQASLEALIDLIKKEVFADYETHTYLIPFDQGRYVEALNQNAEILATEYLPEGTQITANLAQDLAGKLQTFLVQA
ncbi:GTP-binding protein [Ligilactobacillus equi DPC 6820]|uniref:GTPase HflX n=1 Tax=Ligilactobacillus equi DPC 6820 TaxID=1392007 RepID=V7HUU5_9LACO|nr:GTP-binding protein [Ligilactobacillus equi DPC 6820]